MELIIFLVLITSGYLFGRAAEKSHFQSIFEREKLYHSMLTFAVKTPTPELVQRTKKAQLVGGSVVISVDYFKRFIAALRNFFGGNMSSYESLLDRGRREAILRMKKEALEIDAQMIFNVKIETASVSKGKGDSIGSIEVYAYGTALCLQPENVHTKSVDDNQQHA